MCGQCKQCRGPLHFAEEVKNGMLCGSCGPGGCMYQGAPIHEKAIGEVPRTLTALEKKLALNAPAKTVPTAEERATIAENDKRAREAAEKRAVELGQKMQTPDQVINDLKSKGMNPGQCPYCLLADAGMNVSSVVVPHLENCPKRSGNETETGNEVQEERESP